VAPPGFIEILNGEASYINRLIQQRNDYIPSSSDFNLGHTFSLPFTSRACQSAAIRRFRGSACYRRQLARRPVNRTRADVSSGWR
jgi:hypothetical protein